MNRNASPWQLSEVLERLRYYALSAIELEEDLRRAKLTFVSTVDGEPDIAIELPEPLFVKISRTPDDDAPYLVGDIRITALDPDEENRLLTTLNYSFRQDDTNVVPSFGKQLFHLSMEGSICLDIVCQDYSIRLPTP